MTKVFLQAAAIAAGIFLAIQLIPYGRDHANPPVVREPEWDKPRTRELFQRSCGNCHSNETVWPWYSSMAPLSWLVQEHVDDGREHFNVSEWGRKKNKGDEAAGEVREGEMPPFSYLLANPDAKFTPEEREEFIQGLIRTFGEKQDADERGD